MRTPQREHPEAAAELDAAVHWYEQEQTGLGSLLLDRAGKPVATSPGGPMRRRLPEL